ncbi:MAG: class I SAM-dependent methyltransferase [Gammaproteobacteria bacterium]|jgi:ubiquinone/menaquinone biosynthesis C-methylase UbiE|nr:class I SAM-dependent methyltransferase [Gammaproteobacteria bacterium]
MNNVHTSNAEFVAFWNEVLVAKWERFRNILMEGMSYHSDGPLNALALPAGARALDIGCGWGDTAIALAHKVGPTGEVLGLDCCESFLERGRRDATSAGLHNLRFIAADAQDYPFEQQFDFCFSRFGMMFFANPVAAMRAIRRALKPGGELLFVSWRALDENPWLSAGKQILLQFLPPPGEDAQVCGPGPFSMANAEVVTRQLKAAGFTDVSAEPLDGPVIAGENLEQAVDFQLAVGPAGEIFREAGEMAERRRPILEHALRRKLARFEQPDGRIIMDSASWAYRARNPGTGD